MSAHALLQTAHRFVLPADLKFLRRADGPMLKESGHSGPSMPLKTLIVDDEPIARKVLREELEAMEGIEIVGEAGTWLAQRPRYHVHYTPTYSSWLNQVE